jgi:hypothetical protein
MAGIVDRVKNILLSPKTEWQVIDGESGDTKEVFTYVAILAAIPTIISLALSVALSSLVPFSTTYLVVSTIVSYLLTFVIVYLLAMITDALAATFGGEKHMPSALKLIAYSYTAIWVASVLAIIPILGFLLVLAAIVYSVYTLYLGVPVMMRAPQDKVVGYTIVIVISGLVVAIVLGWVVNSLILGSVLRAAV